MEKAGKRSLPAFLIAAMKFSVLQFSAEGGTRTPTGIRPLRPERSASTNSTTSAKS